MPDQNVPYILMVDDTSSLRKIVRKILKGLNCRIEEAINGEEALQKIDEEPPDLILLDIMLPKIDGFEVLSRIKQNPKTRPIPVIMMTSLNEDATHSKALDLGADGFITKPFQASLIVSLVNHHLKAKILTDEVRRLDTLKDDLTRIIVHDLRNPLGTVQGRLVLSFMRDTKEEILADLTEAQEALDDALGLIQNLLDISRMEEGRMIVERREGNPVKILGEIIQRMNFLASSRNLQLMLSAHDQISCVADWDLYRRAVINLASNAIKYADVNSKVEIGLRMENKTLITTVQNCGPSIPAEWRDKIFDKFSQVEMKNRQIGAGLGLSFCKHVAQIHGGDIRLTSPHPDGTNGVIFTLSIPSA